MTKLVTDYMGAFQLETDIPYTPCQLTAVPIYGIKIVIRCPE